MKNMLPFKHPFKKEGPHGPVKSTDKVKNLFECDLCVLEKRTDWYFESDKLVVCNCMTCHIPMVLLRRHTMAPTQEEIDEINLVCDNLYGKALYTFRTNQRRIPDHLHWHILIKEKESAQYNGDKTPLQEVRKPITNGGNDSGK